MNSQHAHIVQAGIAPMSAPAAAGSLAYIKVDSRLFDRIRSQETAVFKLKGKGPTVRKASKTDHLGYDSKRRCLSDQSARQKLYRYHRPSCAPDLVGLCHGTPAELGHDTTLSYFGMLVNSQPWRLGSGLHTGKQIQPDLRIPSQYLRILSMFSKKNTGGMEK